jgi:outer membrane immunogenic protein
VIKKILVVLSAAALCAATANAAEPTGGAVNDWSGFYVGLNAGYGGAGISGQYDMEDYNTGDVFVEDGEGDVDFSPSNFLGGVHGGYNFQADEIVLGLEADFTSMDMSDSLIYRDDDDELSVEMGWVSTVRARAGIATGDALLYATGGVAFADYTFFADDDIDSDDPDDRGSKDISAVGLVLGGGIAYAIDESWSIRGEALYAFFDHDEDIDGVVPADSDGNPGDHLKLQNYYALKGGVSFSF